MTDTIYCDASHFTDGRVFIGIVQHKRAWRIQARAVNINAAELLAIILARKLCGPGRIVSDAQVVVNQVTNKKVTRSMIKTEARESVYSILDHGMLTWERRRSTFHAVVADTLTRREISPGARYKLQKAGISLVNVIN